MSNGKPENTGNPYQDGYKAYALYTRTTCPYDKEIKKRKEWLRGFDDAQSKGDGLWYD